MAVSGTLLDQVIDDVAKEISLSYDKFPNAITSMHEGHSVIEEEYEEFWMAVRKDRYVGEDGARKEALQVAAMAIRFICDLDSKLGRTAGPERNRDV